MKFKTNKEIYDYILKEIQKWFIKKYYGKILQSFTLESCKIPGVVPNSIGFIEEDNFKIYCDYYSSDRMTIIIEITTRVPLFYKQFVYYNDSSYSIVYNLHNVESIISSYIDRMVVSNDGD